MSRKPGIRNRQVDNIDNVYRRINKRMQELFETFGEESTAYQEYAAIVSGNKLKTVTKGNGLIQIKRGKANAMPNDYQRRGIEKLLKSGETTGSLKASALSDLLKHKPDGYIPSQQEVLDYAKKVDYVKGNKEMITYISEQLKAGYTPTAAEMDLYNRAHGRVDEMSYDELFEMMQAIENS